MQWLERNQLLDYSLSDTMKIRSNDSETVLPMPVHEF